MKSKIKHFAKEGIFPVRPPVDVKLLFLLLALSLIGSLMIFSASTAYAETRFGDAYYFIKRQSVWLILGLITMLLVCRISPTRFSRYALPIFLSAVFLLALVPFLGSEAGGAKRWLALGPFTFQPSELSKTALILLLARYFAAPSVQDAMAKRGKRNVLYGIVYPILLFLSVTLLVLLEKHLSCIIILGCITVCMIFLAGGNGRVLGTMCFGGGAAVTVFALSVEYTRRRITIWRNPALYPRDGGWQTLQGLMAIGSGGLFGLGLGNSRLKHMYVSEPQNDFIFTIVCEELGLVGATLILSLFALLVIRGFVVGGSISDRFSSLLGMGLTAKLAIQVLLNIAVITNALPNTGISLPFFSYGGSSLVMLFAEMGILLSLSREAHIRR
ncbi:MAG: cell division protein FtsW [Ruminococcaceae bacterium]|nr:cell division protein FtsW [Oscillospiraceae bacterium]